jgi:hypothetical protein
MTRVETILREESTPGLDTGFGGTTLFENRYLLLGGIERNSDRPIHVCDLQAGSCQSAPTVSTPGNFTAGWVFGVRW